MSHLCQSKMSPIEDCEDVYVGPVCWEKPTGMERRTDARMGDTDAVKALSGTRRDQGGAVATVWCGSTDDPSMGVGRPVAARRLAILNATPSLDTLRSLPGNRLEALRGDRKGQYSINRQWRLCFEWPDGQAGPDNVEIVDYHG